MIFIGSDHRGFELKQLIIEYLKENGLEYEDVGPYQYNKDDDFVDFGILVAQAVTKDPNNRGILMCRNGVGMDVVANKQKGIRACIAFDKEQVRLARNDDDINVISLASDFIAGDRWKAIIDTFLNTAFEGHERQMRRLDKIKNLES